MTKIEKLEKQKYKWKRAIEIFSKYEGTKKLIWNCEVFLYNTIKRLDNEIIRTEKSCQEVD